MSAANQSVKETPPKPGQVRQFTGSDVGTPIHGWCPSGDNIINSRGWGLMHVVVGKESEGVMKDFYDQFILVENPGAVVVCLTEDGKVGMIRNFRFNAERLPNVPNNATYVKTCEETGQLGNLLPTLGKWQWELPRGMAPPSNADKADLNKYILSVAKVEAAQEGGFQIKSAQVCKGRVNANTTFFPHAQYIVTCQLSHVTTRSPEPGEVIGQVRLFSKSEIFEMIENGELEDGFTLAALVIAGFFK